MTPASISPIPSRSRLQSDVEYQLQRDGKPVGLFDIDTSAREQGGWVGYGKWRPLAKAKSAPAQVAKVDEDDDAQSDVPILHRKHHADDSTGGAPGRVRVPAPGRVRPLPIPIVLRCTRAAMHRVRALARVLARALAAIRHADSSAPPPDSDRPVLHRGDDSSASGNASSSASSDDSSRPKLKKKKKDDEEAYVADVASAADPDRPHLVPGKFAGYGAPVVPTLFGLPIDMHQTVAVSDAVDRPEHPWNYIWANPDDEDKMKDCHGGSCAGRAGAQSASRS